jgi:hypothetical protein
MRVLFALLVSFFVVGAAAARPRLLPRFGARRALYPVPTVRPAVVAQAPFPCDPACGCDCRSGAPCTCAAAEQRILFVWEVAGVVIPSRASGACR